jgi:hypothetical protein
LLDSLDSLRLDVVGGGTSLRSFSLFLLSLQSVSVFCRSGYCHLNVVRVAHVRLASAVPWQLAVLVLALALAALVAC